MIICVQSLLPFCRCIFSIMGPLETTGQPPISLYVKLSKAGSVIIFASFFCNSSGHRSKTSSQSWRKANKARFSTFASKALWKTAVLVKDVGGKELTIFNTSGQPLMLTLLVKNLTWFDYPLVSFLWGVFPLSIKNPYLSFKLDKRNCKQTWTILHSCKLTWQAEKSPFCVGNTSSNGPFLQFLW